MPGNVVIPLLDTEDCCTGLLRFTGKTAECKIVLHIVEPVIDLKCPGRLGAGSSSVFLL